MPKLNLLFLLFLMGCSSSLPEEDIYVVEEPEVTVTRTKPQPAQPYYQKSNSSSQNTVVTNSPNTQDDVFSLLDRNHAQVKRIYRESTKKISLQPEIDPRQQKDMDCTKYCGEGYSYDRPGAKNNGQELVCTKYPLKCGYNCTRGWKFRYLVNNTNYTCQEAQQVAD